MSNVVQLEAFEATLRSRRIRWFLSPNQPTTYPPGFQEQLFLETPPFQRRILLTTSASSEAWKLVDRWDAILLLHTAADWSLALTVCINQPAPALVIMTPELKPPPAFFTKCQTLGLKGPTIVHFQILTLPVPPTAITFDATFFPPSKSFDDTTLEATQIILQQTLSSNVLRNFDLKDAIRDLRGAGATIVVSCIGEQEAVLEWVYATEAKAKQKDIVSAILQTMLLRE
jgi:hypothetical protein